MRYDGSGAVGVGRLRQCFAQTAASFAIGNENQRVAEIEGAGLIPITA